MDAAADGSHGHVALQAAEVVHESVDVGEVRDSVSTVVMALVCAAIRMVETRKGGRKSSRGRSNESIQLEGEKKQSRDSPTKTDQT